MNRASLFIGVLLCAIQSNAHAFTHTCHWGVLPDLWPGLTLNPTVFSEIGITPSEQREWQDFALLNRYSSSNYNESLLDREPTTTSPIWTFYFTQIQQVNKVIHLRSDFTLHRQFYNVFGLYHEYFPPAEPHRCDSEGVVRDNPYQ